MTDYPKTYKPIGCRLAGDDRPRYTTYYFLGVVETSPSANGTPKLQSVRQQSPISASLSVLLEGFPNHPNAPAVIAVLHQHGGPPEVLYRWVGGEWVLNEAAVRGQTIAVPEAPPEPPKTLELG